MLPKQPAPADPAGSEPLETPDTASPPDAATGGPDGADDEPTGVLPAVTDHEDTDHEDSEAEGAEADGVEPAGDAGPVDPARAQRVRALTVVAAVAVVLLAAAGLLAFGNHETRTSGVLGNEALVDTDVTAAVISQLTSAVKAVYSYDYKTLDRTEADAKQLITGEFAGEFDNVFAPVKELAPKEQAVLNTEVPAAGVMQLDGDRARVLMMVDQRGTRAGNQPLPPVSARLVVEAERVDGHWKIAKVTPE